MNSTREPEGLPPDRWLPLVGADNVRDLGGLPLIGGGTTRFRQLLRADTLQELTPDDVNLLASYPLRTVLDLRTAVEAEREGRGLLEKEPVSYANLPFVPDAVIVPDDPRHEVVVADRRERDRVEHYLDYLRLATDRVVEALELLAQPDRTPAVFHCAAGQDRTGVLAALMLEIAGVQRSAVLDDYELTNVRLPLIGDRLRRLPTYARYVGTLRPEELRADRETMADFLSRLDEEWGGAVTWAHDAGVSPASVTRLQTMLTG